MTFEQDMQIFFGKPSTAVDWEIGGTKIQTNRRWVKAIGTFTNRASAERTIGMLDKSQKYRIAREGDGFIIQTFKVE